MLEVSTWGSLEQCFCPSTTSGGVPLPQDRQAARGTGELDSFQEATLRCGQSYGEGESALTTLENWSRYCIVLLLSAFLI